MHQQFPLHSKSKIWFHEVFQEGDLALMEASTGTFAIARAVNKLPGVTACVVNSHSLVNHSKKKTDKEDALFLAKTLYMNPVSELPLVSIPGDTEMENREIVSHYRKIDELRTQTLNRLHAFFSRQGFSRSGKSVQPPYAQWTDGSH
jgi:transposase